MDTDSGVHHVIWMNLIVCAWLLIVPLALRSISNMHVRWNDAAAALVIGAFSVGAMRAHAHGQLYRIAALLAGAWLAISPFYLGYPPSWTGADVLIGSLIMTITMIDMIQAGSHYLA
jgi:hypothetical protein